MTASLLSSGGRAATVDAAELLARAELGTDDVSVVDIVEPRAGLGVRRVAVVGPVLPDGTPARATTLHARLDRALCAQGLPGLDATHVLAATGDPSAAPPDGAASAASRRLSVVHALLVDGPAASPSGFWAFGPCARCCGP